MRVKRLIILITDYNPDPGVDRVLGPEAYASAEASIAILLEISCLVRQIGTAVTPLFVEASGISS